MGYRIQSMVRDGIPVRQRTPRKKKQSHLDFINQLSCAICGRKPVDPAHLRAGFPLLGKRKTGAGEKPSDVWTTPLCREHHDEQHASSELHWWYGRGIDPFRLALVLYSVSGDVEQAESILSEHRRQ